MSGMLLERDMAMEAIESAMTAGVTVVQGPAGRGKTAVLDAIVARASAAHRLRTWGEEAARLWPFGVLVEALADLGAMESNSPPAGAPDELAAARMHALERLLGRLGADGGALLCVDDAHWADEPSLTFLRRLAERGLPAGVQVVVATRTLEAGSRPVLDRLLAASTVVELAPLTPRAVCEMLRNAGAAVADADCRRASEMTGGNPFLVKQLAAFLGEGSIDLADGRPLDGAVARPIVARISSQGREPLQLARAIAALGREATVARAGRVAGLDCDAASGAAAALERLDLLRGESVELHALVAQALLDDAGPAVCRRLRAVGARVLEDDGANPARVAALLMDAEPAGDARSVGVLERAAAGARSAGAPAEAVQLLERALLEPPAEHARLRVRLALAEARAADGDAEAETDFAAALELATDDAERIAVLVALTRARVDRGSFPAATEAIATAESLLHDGMDAELVSSVQAAGVLARSFTGPDSTIVDLDDPGQRAQSLLTAALTLTIDASSAREQVLQLAADERFAATADPGTVSMVTGVLYFVGELGASIAFSDAAIDAPGRSRQELAVLRYLRAAPLLLVGRLEEAEADARACVEALGRESGWARGGYYLLAHARMERDDVREAVRIMEHEPLGSLDPGAVSQVWHANRARILLGAGDASGALAAALESGRHVVGFEPRGTSYNDWRRPAAFAQLALGDRAEAAIGAREALAVAERWGAPEDLVEPLIVIGLAENDMASLDGAVDAARQGQDIRLQIEALRHRGAALRRGGSTRRAREDLYAARDLATEHGFTRLARLAGEELDAAGARPRSGARTGAAALTASEARVIKLAAGGATNRQIASELFLSTKTVEFHLANAYRKLGVRNRVQLRERIGK